MLKNKPYFTLRIESKNAGIIAKVNGFSLLESQNNVVTEYPVNQVMVNGDNRLSLIVMPTDDKYETQEASLSLFIQEDGAPDSTRILLSQVSYSAKEENTGGTGISKSMPAMKLDSSDNFKKHKNGDIKIEEAVLEEAKIFPGLKEVSQQVYLESNIPRWNYLDADILDFPLSIKEYEENMEKYDEKILRPLYDFNLEIFEAFKDKDIERITNLMAERNSEMDDALYLDKGSYEKELKDELASDFKWKKPYISDFDKSVPTISDDRKLIKIGVQGMIKLVDKDETVFSYYDMWFYRKDGKWHISR